MKKEELHENLSCLIDGFAEIPSSCILIQEEEHFDREKRLAFSTGWLANDDTTYTGREISLLLTAIAKGYLKD